MRRLFACLSAFASSPFRVVVIISAIFLVVGWLVRYLRPLDVSFGVELPGWVRLPGFVAVVAGATVVFKCGVMLSTRGIGTLGGQESFMPREFVSSGPFRFVRNPMSLGGVVLMVGIGLWHRSTFALGICAGLFSLMHAVVVGVEEPGLEKRFGESYRQYKRHVHRWCPRWHPWSGNGVEPNEASRPAPKK